MNFWYFDLHKEDARGVDIVGVNPDHICSIEPWHKTKGFQESKQSSFLTLSNGEQYIVTGYYRDHISNLESPY